MNPNPDRSRDDVRRRRLTETIHVTSAAAVPQGYVRVPTPNAAIFAKAQVLSARHLKPVFVETNSSSPAEPDVYWVHEAIMPELHEWLRSRVFDEDELLNE